MLRRHYPRQQRLIITYARRRWNFGHVTHSIRSRFLSEIAKDLVQEIGVTEMATAQSRPLRSATKRVIDDDTLDLLLDGEIDAKRFLDS